MKILEKKSSREGKLAKNRKIERPQKIEMKKRKIKTKKKRRKFTKNSKHIVGTYTYMKGKEHLKDAYQIKKYKTLTRTLVKYREHILT